MGRMELIAPKGNSLFGAAIFTCPVLLMKLWLSDAAGALEQLLGLLQEVTQQDGQDQGSR